MRTSLQSTSKVFGKSLEVRYFSSFFSTSAHSRRCTEAWKDLSPCSFTSFHACTRYNNPPSAFPYFPRLCTTAVALCSTPSGCLHIPISHHTCMPALYVPALQHGTTLGGPGARPTSNQGKRAHRRSEPDSRHPHGRGADCSMLCNH